MPITAGTGRPPPTKYPAYGDVTYHEAAFKAAFAQPPAPLATGEAAHLPVRDVRFRYHGHEIRTGRRPARRTRTWIAHAGRRHA